MKPSEMKQILAERRIRLSKSLGQNFLHDGNQLRRIAAAGDLTKSDRVLEIGPGLGPLTELLAAQAGSVLAVEKDRQLVDFLRHRFAGTGFSEPSEALGKRSAQEAGSWGRGFCEAPLPGATRSEGGTARDRAIQLHLVHDDALKFLQRESRDWSGWKMVSNLPYSVASPILVELAQAAGCPQRMVVTLQREVAQRLVARPGDEDYGLLTLLIRLRYEAEGCFRVPAGCFFPQPEVDSACVTLLRRGTPLLNREQASAFTKVVKRAFSQRRKMMLKLLRTDWSMSRLTAAWEYLELPPAARAEQVSLENFIDLTILLTTA